MVTVPSGLICFPDEFIMTGEHQAKTKYKDIAQLTDAPQGGHFAAFEQPELLAHDFISFVRKVESRRKDNE